jgi:hypothetical protein
VSARAAGLVVALVAALGSADDGGWRRVGERDGVVVDERSVEGSPLLEVRASGRSARPPAVVLETVWDQREYVRFVPHLKRLDVLAEGPDWILVYERIAMPLVSDRDYTIRLRRVAIPGTGGFEVPFASADAEGPPEDPSHVRVRSIAGAWSIEPDPDGGTRATYTVRSDPGGVVPAWLVNRLQVRVAAEFVRAMLARAEGR